MIFKDMYDIATMKDIFPTNFYRFNFLELQLSGIYQSYINFKLIKIIKIYKNRLTYIKTETS